MKLLEVKSLKKQFGDKEILKDITFDLQESEVLCIIGPSGSGKSTLLRCLTMLEIPDSGSIKYFDDYLCKGDGENFKYADKKTAEKIRNFFGLVFQNFNLFPHFSVLRNITEAQTAVHKIPKDKAKAKALDLLSKLDLSDKVENYPCELSGGEKQRVSIARALALNPKILFFDEPTSALDPELTVEILKVIKNLAKEKMTMVIVTHEMDFAANVADKIIFMDAGHIIECGQAQEVINSPKTDRLKAFLSKMSD
ncbi:MAG: amino acid ABC transporter ATP-binding protein [Clostridia bacterium]|nr:amino acid ABC transporter ATP-binding protein [Clostridia bacterium]